MKFAIAFVAFLACASASYAPYYAAPAYPAYAGAYAHAPAADIKVLPSGFLADTPEVAHAKAAHLAEKSKVASSAAYYVPASYAAPAYAPYAYAAPAAYAAPYAAPYYAGSYAHSVADIKVLPSGFLADTPEVAHAKAAHLAEKSKVASSAAYYAPAAAPHAAPYYAGSYAHSVADIKVLPSGYLADTPEVAHAKAAHFAEKAKSSAAATYAPAHTLELTPMPQLPPLFFQVDSWLTPQKLPTPSLPIWPRKPRLLPQLPTTPHPHTLTLQLHMLPHTTALTTKIS
ncbi:hypothetical protein WDU94_007966 [Cyamophila willieti]